MILVGGISLTVQWETIINYIKAASSFIRSLGLQKKTSPFPLLDLPSDMQLEILRHLPRSQRVICCWVCRGLRAMLLEAEAYSQMDRTLNVVILYKRDVLVLTLEELEAMPLGHLATGVVLPDGGRRMLLSLPPGIEEVQLYVRCKMLGIIPSLGVGLVFNPVSSEVYFPGIRDNFFLSGEEFSVTRFLVLVEHPIQRDRFRVIALLEEDWGDNWIASYNSQSASWRLILHVPDIIRVLQAAVTTEGIVYFLVDSGDSSRKRILTIGKNGNWDQFQLLDGELPVAHYYTLSASGRRLFLTTVSRIGLGYGGSFNAEVWLYNSRWELYSAMDSQYVEAIIRLAFGPPAVCVRFSDTVICFKNFWGGRNIVSLQLTGPPAKSWNLMEVESEIDDQYSIIEL